MATSIRVTKAQRFADISAMLNGETPQFGTDIQTALEFIDHEVALLSKKNASGDKRKAANAEKDAAFKALIVDFLATLDASSNGMTCSEIGKSITELADFNTSKLSSLCNGLVADGMVVKSTVKGKSLFRLA